VGPDDGDVVDAQDQGTPSQRLRHGGQDRRARSPPTTAAWLSGRVSQLSGQPAGANAQTVTCVRS